MCFPLEHPLDVIKTTWQANPTAKNELQVGRDIYGAKGFKGFYSGSTPNLTRMILKNFYRFPLMLYLPPIFEKVTDNEFL